MKTRTAAPATLLALLLLEPALVPVRAQTVPTLNHAYVYLEPTAYDALAHAAFLRDTFATVREAQVSDLRGSWSGLYLFGRRTYLELYRTGPSTPPPGTFALAFGFDTSGAIGDLERRLRSSGRVVTAGTRQRVVGRDTIPWFTQLGPSDADSAAIAPSARWWVMEYDSHYIARRGTGEDSLDGRVDRESYQRRLFNPTLALEEVTGMVVRLDESRRLALAGQLRELGLQLDTVADTLRLSTAGFAVDLVAAAAGERGGVVRLRLGVAPRLPAGGWVGTEGALLTADGRGTAELRVQSTAPSDTSGCGLTFRIIRVEGRAVATCRGGTSGPLVVFESGLGDGMAPWRELADSVARFARVLLYERAGIGASEPVTGPRDAAAVARELKALLDVLGEPGPAILVAHSLGGMYARVAAAEHPELFRGLLLIDPTPEDFAGRQREEFGADGYRAFVERIERQLAGAARREWDGLSASAEAARARGWPHPVGAAVVTSGRIVNPDPVLGPRMKQIWKELHRTLAERIGGRHVVVDSAGHYVHRDAPTLVLVELRTIVTAVVTAR